MKDYYLRINSDFEYLTDTNTPSFDSKIGVSLCGRFSIYHKEDNTIHNELVSTILGKKVVGDYIIGIEGNSDKLRGFCTEVMAVEYMNYIVDLYNSRDSLMSNFTKLQ